MIKLLSELLSRTRLLFVMQCIARVVVIVSKEYADYVLAAPGDDVLGVLKDYSAIVIASPKEVIMMSELLTHITGLFAR
ncbi:MAG: hypothetical protein ABWW69_01710 [Pyrodictiaceae archaeon]